MSKNVKVRLFIYLNYIYEQDENKGIGEQKAKNNPQQS